VKVLAGVAEYGVPRIHFGVGTGELLVAMRDGRGRRGRRRLAYPARRCRPAARRDRGRAGQPRPGSAARFLAGARGRDSPHRRRRPRGGRHIFNLGHGVLPGVDPEVLTRVVGLVHEL